MFQRSEKTGCVLAGWDEMIEIYKTLWPYMGPRLCQQDAWPSFLREYTSFAFGSTDTWRQLTGYTNGLRLVPPLGNLLLLRHVYSACVVTIMLRSITCMVYGGGYEACHQDLYDPTGEQDLDGFDGFDC